MILISGAAFCCPAISYGQNFAPVDSGFNYSVTRLEIDTANNLMYAFGNFDESGSTIGFNYMARYDGVQWDTIPELNNYYTTYSYRYGGQTFFGNSLVCVWDGIQVDTIATFPFGPIVFGMIEYNGDLYAYGAFDTINGVPASNVAKWNGGTSWSALDTTKFVSGGAFVTAIVYNGGLYLGGNVISTTMSIYDLAKWDGTQLTQVGGGITSGTASVGAMEIYNGDLYISGNFNVTWGNPGNSIARWDGSQWKDTGGGFPVVNSVVYDLQVYNGELYASGTYTNAGGQPINALAKWDETDWCGLGFTSSPGGPSARCMAVYNSELYIGGGFLTVNSDTMNRITKWIGGTFTDFCGNTTGLAESITSSQISVFPNPAESILTIETADLARNNSFIEIRNLLGQLVYSQTIISNEQKIQIDVSPLESGLYLLNVNTTTESIKRKFIKK